MPELSADRKKLLDQLLKLLALAQGTTFAAEAESARAKADELMRKHNLSVDEGAKDRTKLIIEPHAPWAKGAQWELIIAHALGELCGCAVYHYNYQSYELVGTVSNVEALRYMIDMVGQQRIRAWLEYKKTGPDKLWEFSFSFSKALEEKIDRLLAGAMAIKAEKRRVELWFESTHIVTKTSTFKGRGSSTAGRAAGANASLHRGEMGGPGTQRQITGPRRRLTSVTILMSCALIASQAHAGEIADCAFDRAMEYYTKYHTKFPPSLLTTLLAYESILKTCVVHDGIPTDAELDEVQDGLNRALAATYGKVSPELKGEPL